jgi:hypothetical protein
MSLVWDLVQAGEKMNVRGGTMALMMTLILSAIVLGAKGVEHSRGLIDESGWDCDFDSNSFCYFDTDGGWQVKSGSTPTTLTGPLTDFSGTGYYVYTEGNTPAWSNAAGNGGFKLQLDFGYSFSGIGVSFYYNMYGYQLGTLRIYTSTDGTTFSNIWETSGDRGINATWEYGYAAISNNPVSIRFVSSYPYVASSSITPQLPHHNNIYT